jgi:hypothetical protein
VDDVLALSSGQGVDFVNGGTLPRFNSRGESRKKDESPM